jgi:hypothetical protein
MPMQRVFTHLTVARVLGVSELRLAQVIGVQNFEKHSDATRVDKARARRYSCRGHEVDSRHKHVAQC